MNAAKRPAKEEPASEPEPNKEELLLAEIRDLLKEKQDVKKLGFESLRLNFTLESAGETRKIARDFIQCYQKNVDSCAYILTKGHFRRGVE